MSNIKTHVKKGDVVRVISGDHRNSEGKVLGVYPAKNRAVIEGVNMIKKHQKKSQDHPQGAIIEREGTIHLSNLKLVEKQEKKTGKSKKAA